MPVSPSGQVARVVAHLLGGCGCLRNGDRILFRHSCQFSRGPLSPGDRRRVGITRAWRDPSFCRCGRRTLIRLREQHRWCGVSILIRSGLCRASCVKRRRQNEASQGRQAVVSRFLSAGTPRFRRWRGQIAGVWWQESAGWAGGMRCVLRVSVGGGRSVLIAGRSLPGPGQVTRVAGERVGREAGACAPDRVRGQRRKFG